MQVSAFYNSPNPPQHLVRFCFCKSREKLEAACNQMEDYFRKRQNGLQQNGSAQNGSLQNGSTH